MPPPTPFPLPLHIGTDICQISRIARLLRGPLGPRFVRRLLGPGERDAARPQLGDPDAPDPRAATFLAGRFAAKEAVIKAHPGARLSFHQIVVRRAPPDAPGPPVALVRGREARLSISHDGDYATAVCLAAADGAGR